MKIKFTILLAFVFAQHLVCAQAPEPSDLFESLQEKDSLLFSVAFNVCNIQQLESLTHEDFEFYHDQGGITDSKSAFIDGIKNNLCSTGENVVHRELDRGSLAVYPLYQEGKLYGAVQTGTHRFGDTNAQFTHVWLLENSEWKLSRVLSYNHQ